MKEKLVTQSRTKLILLTMLASTLCAVVVALVKGKWIGYLVLVGIFTIIYTWYFIKKKDTLLPKFFIAFGITAALFEILTADVLAVKLKTLVYPAGGPFIKDTPLFVLFTWGGLIAQLGYIGWILKGKFRMDMACLLVGFLGVLYMGIHEILGGLAGAWHYANAHMLFGIPFYLMVAEFAVIAVTPLMIQFILKRKNNQIWPFILMGIINGALTKTAGYFAWQLIDAPK